jgi:hypothetical protein
VIDRAALGVWGMLLLGVGPAGAQSMHAYTATRQLHGETRLEANIDFAAGTVRLAPAQQPYLYSLKLEYDRERFRPVSSYDTDGHRVILGLAKVGDWELRVPSKKQLSQTASITLSPTVDLQLDATFGAVDAELELGGLRLTTLVLKTGASRVVARFSKRNNTPCRSASFAAGAAELKIYGLGNSRCREIDLEGGVGSVTLDFTGAWTSDTKLRLMMAAGELTLRLPTRVGVHIAIDKSLVRFEPEGFTRRGREYFSEGYRDSERRLDIELTTSFAGLNVEWVE